MYNDAIWSSCCGNWCNRILTLPPFLSPSPYQPPVTPGGLTKRRGRCSCALKQQGRGGDLLEKFMKGCILDVTLENDWEHEPACPEKFNHLVLLNEQTFVFCNCGICEVLPCLRCKAEVLHELSNLITACIHSVVRDSVVFFRALCIVFVDSLCFSAVLLCPGTLQVAWENWTSRMLRFVAGRAGQPLGCFLLLCHLHGVWFYFCPLGILGSAEFVLCFAEERAC